MSFIEEAKSQRLGATEFKVNSENARLHAHFHLYSVVGAGTRGVMGWEKARIAARPTIIYDLSGLPLFYDFPVRRGRNFAGFIRMAANKALGDSVVSTQVTPLGWDMDSARKAWQKLVKKKYAGHSIRSTRLVCYSYPKLALSGELISPRREKKTILMDVADFTEVRFEKVEKIEDSGQIPYSFLAKIPENRLKEGPKIWERFDKEVGGLFKKARKLHPTRVYELAPKDRLQVIEKTIFQAQLIKLYTQRVLDFCCHTGACRDHECFCLHPQENSVHCTRASSQMILCYWRYCYSQHDVAQAFGVADTDLTPWSSVASGLNSLTHNCFNATLDYSVSWTDCENEIQNRRPFLSDDGGHTRACAGTKKWWIWIYGQPQPRYLYIFDPWPPNVGAIYWENFNTAYYAWNGTLVRKTTNHA